MAGLRERKKEQTRQRIAAAALRLFAERGFNAVTVNEIAADAEVAKATLFAYFPTKESLILQGVGEEDLAGVVAARPSGQTPLEALRAYYRDLVAGPDRAVAAMAVADRDALVVRMHMIFESPVLSAAANGLLHRQRQALARELAEAQGKLTASLMAAQITASLLALQESFFKQLAEGVSPEDAGRGLADGVELAFDLLEHGMDSHAEPAKGQ